MARWTDVADWIGPTPNRRPNGITAHRGLVLHIQEGSEAGTEAWQRNPKSQISSHFLAPKTGRPRQMVDTNDVAWTEAAGNDEWLSVEIEGQAGDRLTADQLAGIAAIYARGVRDHNWPLAVTDNPKGVGLGWHGMGGTAWGGHSGCPGGAIVAQRPQILAAAKPHTDITATTEEDTMPAYATGQLPTGFAVDATGTIDPAAVVIITTPAGRTAGIGWGDMYLRLGCDFGSARLRVAVHSGVGWDVKTVDLNAADGAKSVAVAPSNNTGCKVSIARVQKTPGDTADSVPVSWMLELGNR